MKPSFYIIFYILLATNLFAQETRESGKSIDDAIKTPESTELNESSEKKEFDDYSDIFIDNSSPFDGLTQNGIDYMTRLEICMVINPALNSKYNMTNNDIPQSLLKNHKGATVLYLGFDEAVFKLKSVMKIQPVDAKSVLLIKPQLLLTGDIIDIIESKDDLRIKVLIRLYGLCQNDSKDKIVFNLIFEDARWGRSLIKGGDITSSIVKNSILNAFESGLLLSFTEILPARTKKYYNKSLDHMIPCEVLAKIGGNSNDI